MGNVEYQHHMFLKIAKVKPYQNTSAHPFSDAETCAEADAENIEILRSSLYPPQGGLNTSLLRKVPQAGTGLG